MFVFLLKSFNYLPIVNMYQFKGEQRILKISPNSIFVLKIRNPLCAVGCFGRAKSDGVGGWGDEGGRPPSSLFFSKHTFTVSLSFLV